MAQRQGKAGGAFVLPGVNAQKKTDAVEYAHVFGRIGLLFTEPPGTAKLLFI
jgi:hypothetical protein